MSEGDVKARYSKESCENFFSRKHFKRKEEMGTRIWTPTNKTGKQKSAPFSQLLLLFFDACPGDWSFSFVAIFVGSHTLPKKIRGWKDEILCALFRTCRQLKVISQSLLFTRKEAVLIPDRPVIALFFFFLPWSIHERPSDVLFYQLGIANEKFLPFQLKRPFIHLLLIRKGDAIVLFTTIWYAVSLYRVFLFDDIHYNNHAWKQ